MVVKIEFNDETGTLTFPYNPQSFDDELTSNSQTTPIPYSNHNVVVTGGGNNPKRIVLTGHFSGDDKETNYKALSKFQFSKELQRLYFASDRYYLGFLRTCKKTYGGGRTNFIDYVATFETISSVIFGDTQRTSGINAGNITTFVEEITGQHDGAGDIVLSDGTNDVTIAEADLVGNAYFRYSFVKMISSGTAGQISISKFGVIEVDDNAGFTSPTYVTSQITGLLQLAAAANITTVTATNVTGTPTKKFRDGYSA